MTRGVVLGGGGIAGVAWEAGIVIGLRRAGVDLSSADVIVGTSAGSIVGSHVAFGTDLQTLAAMPPASPGAGAAAAPAVSLEVILSALAPLFDQRLDPTEARRRVGAAARAAGGDEQPYIARIASLLPATDRWPQRRLLVTAVDAESGEPVAWHGGRRRQDHGIPHFAGRLPALQRGEARGLWLEPADEHGGCRRGPHPDRGVHRDRRRGLRPGSRVTTLACSGGRCLPGADWGV